MLRARLAAALVAAAMLALPATALADSAGDNQYQDPFANTPKQQKQQSSGSQGGSTQAPAAAPAPTAQTTAAPAAPAQAGTLPRTGFPLLPVAAVGAALVAAGVALRRLV